MWSLRSNIQKKYGLIKERRGMWGLAGTLRKVGNAIKPSFTEF